jgi:transposase
MSQENAKGKQPLIRPINRQQLSWRAVDVERLIGEDHRARAIWALVGRMDLQRFYDGIESSAEEGGRPAIDPQLLISLWVYAYSEGIGSAREVARVRQPLNGFELAGAPRLRFSSVGVLPSPFPTTAT